MKPLTAMMSILLAFSVGALVLFPSIYAEEGIPDTDGDGIPDDVDVDIDGDGVPNLEEAVYGTDPYDKTSFPVIEEMR
ncbi:MAG: hypothetical protein EFT35_03195 [Methanophagales archaeon ANME-1-THS]|nr:MAG: hypothetical protein EFT35_03195 [Methanophagales archaeon ANME-1-THS]